MSANPNFTYLKEVVPKQRVSLLQGGTRSGKSYSVIYYLIWLCHQHRGMEIDIVRDTFTALKATAWKDFKDVLLQHSLYHPDNHNKTDHVYELNGNTISYYGADNPAKIHGRARDILWINEAQQFPEDIVDQLMPRTRHRIICDYNPALGAEHWLDPYMEKHPPLITTYKDNPHLTQAQIEDIESKKRNKYWWTIYGSGQRAVAEGVVFENWSEGKFEPTEFWFGMDFGYSNDPTALIRIGIDKRSKTIYLKEEVYQTHLKTTEIAELCKRICGRSLIIADSAEPRLIAELKAQRINIQGAKKVSIVEGVVLMNDYSMIVDGANLKKELSLYRWADKGKTVPIDMHNHAIDAARYGVMFSLINPNYGKYAIG